MSGRIANKARYPPMSTLIVRTISAAALLASTAAYAETAPVAAQASANASLDGEFARFAPRDAEINQTIDYLAWTQAMDYLVLRMGRSLRESPGTVESGMGTRRIFGHDSRYRLEGNRVMFSFFTPELKQMVADYRQELQSLPSSIDIAALPRNEQLSFWLNLHNVALIEQIAQNWPVRQPSTIEIDGVPLDEAKFITVDGVAMSPKDIRTKIVYPNWQDPKVIYGFWRGDIGGPSIQAEAYDAGNVSRLLEKGSVEFVNSLRGTQKRGDRLQVSTIFEEARPFYFPNWEEDIRAHIGSLADEEVTELLAETGPVEATIYEADIADLAGGMREPSYSNITMTSGDGIERQASFRIPPSSARLLRERDNKFRKIIKDARTGRVIFHSIDLPGQETNTEVK